MRKSWRNIISLATVGVFLIGPLITGCTGAQPKEQQGEQYSAAKRKITIGTAPAGGTYYPIGGAIAEILNSKVAGVEATAVTTGGSVENLRLLDKGEITIGFAMATDVINAHKGAKPFEKPIKPVAAIATLYPNTWQMVTLRDSGITSWTQLKGKKVGVGPAGSGVETGVKMMFEAYGMTYKDFTPVFLGSAESVEALQNRQVTAAVLGGSIFNASLKALASTVPIRLIPVDQSVLDKVREKAEGTVDGFVVKAGTFPGVMEDTLQPDWLVQLAVRADEDEKLVYAITKAIFENLATLQQTHEAGKYITLDRAPIGKAYPFHPGARKYYIEKGVWKD